MEDINNSELSKAGLSRRNFVKQSAITGGALIFSGLLPGSVKAANMFLQSGILEKTDLTEGWKIKSFAHIQLLDQKILADAMAADVSKEWLPVESMPSMVHEILLHHKKIEEPWKPFGMENCYWVSEKDWVYSVNFNAKKTTGENRLIFKGIKGHADVYLNGIHVAIHSVMSLPLIIDVTGKIKSKNSLVLHFAKGAPKVKGVPENPDQLERSPMGSYLGPNPMIYTSGLFDSVILENTDGSIITGIVTDVSLDKSLAEGTVTIDVSGRSRYKKVEVQTQLIGPDGQIVKGSTIISKIIGGKFNSQLVIRISKPELWWPRGYGQQKMYKIETSLLLDGRIHQKEYRTIGFRKITMPEKLHFVVNGVPVFLRGGAWVTPDLLSDVWNQNREETLFTMAENANFNAFRIWGEVQAPHDRFYEIADERGFLLWQDFTMLPLGSEKKDIDTCVEKATRFVMRLKHHPSVLSWCGGNEAAMWAHEDYNGDFKDHGPWKGLPAAEAVGEVCRQFDPERYYQPSTPYYGMNPNDPREGNTHGYTNMWYVPGYDYLNFASEDTRCAAPTLPSMQKFMKPEEIFPDGYSTMSLPGTPYPFPQTWLPYTNGESWKKTGPIEQFYDANDAASLINRIGMAEGLYYRDLIERQRRGRPATETGDRRCCGGYIVWKFNDSWPEIYSAKIDYFLEPYHAYYFLRRAYEPVMLSFDIDTFIYLWAVNDTRTSLSGTIRIQLYHLEACEFRKEIIKEVTVEPGKSMVVVRLDQAGIRAFRKEHILYAALTDKDGRVIARTNAMVDIERRLKFPDAILNIKTKDNYLIISTDKFAHSINLEGDADGDRLGWFFEDNYFDLLPGEEKIVHILGTHSKGKISAKAWYAKNATTVNWQKS